MKQSRKRNVKNSVQVKKMWTQVIKKKTRVNKIQDLSQNKAMLTTR